MEADVVVVGAGPAGATCALNLGALHRVLVVERRAAPVPRIGESLPPAARRLLTDMGLWESFVAEAHAPCYANRAVWGRPAPAETDVLRNPDGPGWHLDRARFERWLRDAALARGAALIAPAHLTSATWDGDLWRLGLTRAGRTVPITARLLVDAGGRAAPLARRLGGRTATHDRLVGGWIHGTHPDRAGLTTIEAEPDGWWYTAPLPDGRYVLAFHTDADLPAAAATRSVEALLARARALPFLGDHLAAFVPSDAARVTAAHSSRLESPIGTASSGGGWMAIGDAALAFDPLSAQGLLNALYTGLAAAEAADRHLAGDPDALPGYARAIARVWTAYRTHLQHWYGEERRWAGRPFWQRRHAVG